MDIIQRRTKTDSGDYIDMAGDDNPCIRCGACCTLIRVSFSNSELSTSFLAEAGVPVEMTVPVTPFLSAMKGTEFGEGPCQNLEGQLGQKVSCRQYEKRPSPCRLFAVWDENGIPNPLCQKQRARIGLPPVSPWIQK